MSFKTVTTAVVLVLAAGAASAQSINPGDAQLAAAAGVEPGVYSRAQLIELLDAQQEGDSAKIAFILSQGNADVGRASAFESDVAIGPGWDQMADVNGVERGVYSKQELIQMDADRMGSN
jgi:hypothetical protein